MRPAYEVAQVLNRNIENLSTIASNSWQYRTLSAIARCRTAAMGGHIDKCTNSECGELHISYNSCRNRHCPKCQGHKREQWIREREKELIKAPYFHVVFTLPSELHGLCLANQSQSYSILFKVAWSVMHDFAANHKFIGGRSGMIAILHTWGQNLSFHPHLHCIVPGGGLSKQGKWKSSKAKGKYLFPVKAMSKVFRARFVEALRKELELKDDLGKTLFAKSWVIYCKRPFYGAPQVVEYLGRYTHKVAISNHRIKSLDNNRVTFTAKDYRQGGKVKLVTLIDQEFIRRFALHILPKGFTRIRHYGILSSSLKTKILPQLKEELGELILPDREVLKHRKCPVCKKGELIMVSTFSGRDPPSDHKIRFCKMIPLSSKK